MTLFLLIVAGIVFWYYSKKKADEAKRKEAFKEGLAYEKDAREKLKKEYGFTDSKTYPDMKGYNAELHVDCKSNQFAYISALNKTTEVYRASDFIKAEIKENRISEVKENHHILADGALNSSSYVKEMSLYIIMKGGKSINLFFFNDMFARMGLKDNQDRYHEDYARAVELKTTLEEMAGVSQSAAAPSQNSSSSVTDELQRLMKLKEQGVLSDEEFTQAKAKLLA